LPGLPRATASHCRSSSRRISKGAVTLVNFLGFMVRGPDHDEAPLLSALGEDGRIRLVGINYKDQADNARRFLGATAIHSWRPASTAWRASRNGVSTACRRLSWSGAWQNRLQAGWPDRARQPRRRAQAEIEKALGRQ